MSSKSVQEQALDYKCNILFVLLQKREVKDVRKLIKSQTHVHFVKSGQGGVPDKLTAVSQCASTTRPVHTRHFLPLPHTEWKLNGCMSNTFGTFSCKLEGM